MYVHLLTIFVVRCWSFVGNRMRGRQEISLGSGCLDVGTILHEIGHVIGLWHEQSRPDRDDYVRVVERNIADGYLNQFGKRPLNETTSRRFPYDYRSVMHYAKTDFSKNGKPTIQVGDIHFDC